MRDDPKARKILVCLENRCSLCDSSVREAPEDCPFRILHVLRVHDPVFPEECGCFNMKRQCGKTTRLVSAANRLVECGYITYLITTNEKMREMLFSLYRLDKRVHTATEFTWDRRMRGRQRGYVLCDELDFGIVRKIMSAMPWNFLVAAYHTQ